MVRNNDIIVYRVARWNENCSKLRKNCKGDIARCIKRVL